MALAVWRVFVVITAILAVLGIFVVPFRYLLFPLLVVLFLLGLPEIQRWTWDAISRYLRMPSAHMDIMRRLVGYAVRIFATLFIWAFAGILLANLANFFCLLFGREFTGGVPSPIRALVVLLVTYAIWNQFIPEALRRWVSWVVAISATLAVLYWGLIVGLAVYFFGLGETFFSQDNTFRLPQFAEFAAKIPIPANLLAGIVFLLIILGGGSLALAVFAVPVRNWRRVSWGLTGFLAVCGLTSAGAWAFNEYGRGYVVHPEYVYFVQQGKKPELLPSSEVLNPTTLDVKPQFQRVVGKNGLVQALLPPWHKRVYLPENGSPPEPRPKNEVFYRGTGDPNVPPHPEYFRKYRNGISPTHARMDKEAGRHLSVVECDRRLDLEEKRDTVGLTPDETNELITYGGRP